MPIARRRARELGLDPAATVVALLPGSRLGEVQPAGPGVPRRRALAGRPASGAAVHRADGLGRRRRRVHRRGRGAGVRLLDGQARLALQAADAALVASGTATLEALLCRCPMVVAYRTGAADGSAGARCCASCACPISRCPTCWPARRWCRSISSRRRMPGTWPRPAARARRHGLSRAPAARASMRSIANCGRVAPGAPRPRCWTWCSRRATRRHERPAGRCGRGRPRSAGRTGGRRGGDARIRSAGSPGCRDSKRLSPAQRETLAVEIRRYALGFAIAAADATEIDALNILQATLLAMRRALQALPVRPGCIMIDGNKAPQLSDVFGDCPSKPSSAATIWCRRSAPPRSSPRRIATR